MIGEKEIALAREVLQLASAKGVRISLAESCTGGLISACLTSLPGSSRVLEACVVAYSYASKTRLLGISAELLSAHGAVSIPVVEAMALGALQGSEAEVSLGISGVSGPGGGTAEKPVGYVIMCLLSKQGARFLWEDQLAGDRQEIRQQTVQNALQRLEIYLQEVVG
jgi:nicotinamide-nucleotide amidase